MEKQLNGRWTQLIREEVKAQLKRREMAKKREDFINRLVEVLIPALRHHYRVALAIANDRTDQVEKWQEQEYLFLDQFTDRIQEITKAKGLDRRKAVDRAVIELMEQDNARTRGETAAFQKAYKLKFVKPIPARACADFLKRVWEIVDLYFPRGD